MAGERGRALPAGKHARVEPHKVHNLSAWKVIHACVAQSEERRSQGSHLFRLEEGQGCEVSKERTLI